MLKILNVVQVADVAAALEVVSKGVVGAITDFSNRCSEFVKEHPHP